MYVCLQPLCLSLSHKATLNMIDDLCKDHDVIVRQWRDEIKVNSTLGDSVVESANRAEIQVSLTVTLLL